jgi:hypothetical protein
LKSLVVCERSWSGFRLCRDRRRLANGVGGDGVVSDSEGAALAEDGLGLLGDRGTVLGFDSSQVSVDQSDG